MRRRITAAVLTGVLALTGAACGDDDGDDAVDPVEEATDALAPTAEELPTVDPAVEPTE